MAPKPKPTRKPKGRKPPKKKTSRQLAEIRMDGIVKQIVLIRDNGCVCPPPIKGHSGYRTPGHIVSRVKESVKWDLYNVHEQCQGCNSRHEYYPEIYTNWFIENFGAPAYMRIVSDSYKVSKLTIDDLETLEYELNEILKILQGRPDWKPYFTQKQIMSGDWSAK